MRKMPPVLLGAKNRRKSFHSQPHPASTHVAGDGHVGIEIKTLDPRDSGG